MSTVNHRSDGRFAPGNRAALGNPLNRRMQALRKALLDSAEPDDVRRVGKRLLALAEEGDVQAAKVYLDFLIGRPAQAIELSGPDGEPLGVDWERLQTVLLTSLSRFPEARLAVVMALKGLADVDATGPAGDGPGRGGDDALGVGD